MVFFYLITQLSFLSSNITAQKQYSCATKYPKSVCLAKAGCKWKQNTCYGYYKNSNDANTDNNDDINPIQSLNLPRVRPGMKKIKVEKCQFIDTQIHKIENGHGIKQQYLISKLINKCQNTSTCVWDNNKRVCQHV